VFLIILVMFAIVAIAYLFGSAFKFDKLVRFGRAEIGEIIVTIIVITIFMGGIFAVNNPSSVQSVYLTNCENLYSNFIAGLGEFKGLFLSQFILSFVSSLNFGLTEMFFGVSTVTPFGGLSMVTGPVISTFVNLGFLLIGINLAVTFVLGIFYALLPLFFYAGLLLRTFPWTRAAGGAFLGLFGGFYIAFPFLLYLFMIAPCAPPAGTVVLPGTVAPPGSGCAVPGQVGNVNFVQQHLTEPSSAWNILTGGISQFVSYFKGWDFSALLLNFNTTIADIVGPALYTFISIIIAFLISYDILEVLGDLLGAPALSSTHTLRKLM